MQSSCICARVFFFCRAFLFIFVAFGVCVSARARARVPHCTRGAPRTSSPTGVMVRASACDRVNRGGAGSERQRARARWGWIRGRDARARARATTRRLFLAFSAQLFRDSSWCTCRELVGDALRAARARPARARPHPRSPVAERGDFPCPPARRCPTSPTPPRVHADPAAAPTDCRRFKCTRAIRSPPAAAHRCGLCPPRAISFGPPPPSTVHSTGAPRSGHARWRARVQARDRGRRRHRCVCARLRSAASPPPPPPPCPRGGGRRPATAGPVQADARRTPIPPVVSCRRIIGKTTFVKRHISGEFEKKYERKWHAPGCTPLAPLRAPPLRAFRARAARVPLTCRAARAHVPPAGPDRSQRPSVWRSSRLTLPPTSARSGSTAGTPPARRSSAGCVTGACARCARVRLLGARRAWQAQARAPGQLEGCVAGSYRCWAALSRVPTLASACTWVRDAVHCSFWCMLRMRRAHANAIHAAQVLHQGPVRHHDVRRDVAPDVQEHPHLAP